VRLCRARVTSAAPSGSPGAWPTCRPDRPPPDGPHRAWHQHPFAHVPARKSLAAP
jgi:hypothetical protein